MLKSFLTCQSFGLFFLNLVSPNNKICWFFFLSVLMTNPLVWHFWHDCYRTGVRQRFLFGYRGYYILKLDLYDLTYKYTEDKNLVWNHYTLFDSICFSHSNCGSPPLKTYANNRTLLEEKKWRTAGSNQHCPATSRSSYLPCELYSRYEILDLT